MADELSISLGKLLIINIYCVLDKSYIILYHQVYKYLFSLLSMALKKSVLLCCS